MGSGYTGNDDDYDDSVKGRNSVANKKTCSRSGINDDEDDEVIDGDFGIVDKPKMRAYSFIK